MHILVLQETDWIIRGPHTQHHIFEHLSKIPNVRITVIDYDIERLEKSKSIFIKKKQYTNIIRAVKGSSVKILRTPYIRVPFLSRITTLITNFFKILKIIRTDRPDLIVGFSMTNGLIGLLLGKLFRIPYIFYYIDFLHKLVPLNYLHTIAKVFTRFSFILSDLVIIQSEFSKRYAINEGTNEKRIKRIPNGVSMENTIINEQKFLKIKKSLNIADDDFIIFFMGYLYPFAGLLEIVRYYHNDVKNGKYKLKFLIVGDGGVYNKLIRYKESLNADWLILNGRVPFFDLPEYIELADLCLLSFDKNDITNEIVPIKIIEYMAMKKPVLSNSLPAVVLELKKHSDVIFAKNQDDLIKMIGNLIPKKQELKQIGIKGYNLVTEYYIWPKIIDDFKNSFLKLINEYKYY